MAISSTFPTTCHKSNNSGLLKKIRGGVRGWKEENGDFKYEKK